MSDSEIAGPVDSSGEDIAGEAPGHVVHGRLPHRFPILLIGAPDGAWAQQYKLRDIEDESPLPSGFDRARM